MEEDFQMKFTKLQPWSTFVMKTKLPPPILEKMIKITDEIVEKKKDLERTRMASGLAGQIEDEFYITPNELEREGAQGFFLNVCKIYAEQAFSQTYPAGKINQQRSDVSKDSNFGLDSSFIFQSREEWRQKLTARITYMWIVSQKDNEYNPLHVHTHCHVSAVMYLKIPEFLPARKSHSNHDDGAIGFTSNVGKDQLWGISLMMIEPEVGDFFIFPASQQHFVYPFRTADGKGERRSVSFNAIFSSEGEN